MSLKCRRSVLLIKDKQSIIVLLEKGEKGTNLSTEYRVIKQQISDIRQNNEKIMKFADILETSEGLKWKSLKIAHDQQLDKALYAWFIQQRTSGTQFLVPFCKKKRNTFTASYTQILQMATLKLRQDGLRNSKTIMELEI